MFITVLAIIAYSLKDFLSNSISGFMIIRQKVIEVGESVDLNGVVGKVIRVNLIFTEIELEDKSTVILPNSIVVNRKIIKKRE